MFVFLRVYFTHSKIVMKMGQILSKFALHGIMLKNIWGGRYMEGIDFVDLRDELERNNIEWYTPTCCNSISSNFSMLRVQMQGEFSFNRQGVWIEHPEHDEKCMSLLLLAAQKNYDLVLFPEYCISYPVLQTIIADIRLWPQNQKLWVLPCQGIFVDEFADFMRQISTDRSIFVLDKAWRTPKVNRRSFITALFYCFLGYRDGDPVLCLVPQLKTQPMGDHDCLCEQAGMSTGGVIFTLEHRLLTLLCADSMNNSITWQEFQKQHLLMPGLMILHPQLNPHPKDPVFSRLRRELFDHGEHGIFITCNWAKGTALYQHDLSCDSSETIDVSWSCIYRKHSDDIFDRWSKKKSLRKENEKRGLFGAMMRPQRTEVWFSLYYEEALELNIPMPSPTGYGKVQLPDIHAQTRFIYDRNTKGWTEWESVPQTLQQRIAAVCPDGNTLRYSSEAIALPYRFPLDTFEKIDSDQFFALALAEFHNNILEIDEKENLIAWTLLLDESEQETAVDALNLLWKLIDAITGELPPQCAPLKGNHNFCYQPAQDGKPSINFQAEGKKALVAYAESPMRAQKHIKFLRKTECHDDEDLLRQFVRVLYYEPIGRKMACEPQLSADITQGGGILTKGDITNGGNKSDS